MNVGYDFSDTPPHRNFILIIYIIVCMICVFSNILLIVNKIKMKKKFLTIINKTIYII